MVDRTLLISGAGDIAQDKLDLAIRCGAVKTVNSKDPSKAEIVQTGCTIVVTGVAAAYDFGIKATATGGKVIVIGVPHGLVPIDGKFASLDALVYIWCAHIADTNALTHPY